MSSPLTVAAPGWVLERMMRDGLPGRGRGTVVTHRRQRAAPRWCRCGQPVWTGLAERFDVVLDPTPTTVDGELFAVMAGRRTYEMTYHGELVRRRPAHIRETTADDVEVYIAHVCGGPYPIVNGKWAPIPKSDSDIPPF